MAIKSDGKINSVGEQGNIARCFFATMGKFNVSCCSWLSVKFLKPESSLNKKFLDLIRIYKDCFSR